MLLHQIDFSSMEELQHIPLHIREHISIMANAWLGLGLGHCSVDLKYLLHDGKIVGVTFTLEGTFNEAVNASPATPASTA